MVDGRAHMPNIARESKTESEMDWTPLGWSQWKQVEGPVLWMENPRKSPGYRISIAVLG